MHLRATIVQFLFIVVCLSGTQQNGRGNDGNDLNFVPEIGVEDAAHTNENSLAWANFKRVCYFRMDPKTEMEVSDIDGNLCTHVIFAFCRIDRTGNVVFGVESDENYLNKIPELKRRFRHLKVLVSLYNEGEFNGFREASKNELIRLSLAESAIKFMLKYNIDGMDLDWEFPNFPVIMTKSRQFEKIGFTKIVSSLRKAFGARFLLTSAVAAQDQVIKSSYEVDKVAREVDWLNLMTYDYYLFKSYTPFTGPNSPLYPLTEKWPMLRKLSIAWSVAEYLALGVPKEKLVMGIPTYARGFHLVVSSKPKPFTLSSGPSGGKVSDYYDYREVCEFMRKNDTKIHFDEKAKVPYMTSSGSIWTSFENEESIRLKIDFAVKRGLAGYMTWNLNSDNFNTACYPGDERRNILHQTMFQRARTLINPDN